MIQSSGSGFGGGNPPIDPKGVGFCGHDPQLTSKWSVRTVFNSGSSRLLRLVGSSGLGGQS